MIKWVYGQGWNSAEIEDLICGMLVYFNGMCTRRWKSGNAEWINVHVICFKCRFQETFFVFECLPTVMCVSVWSLNPVELQRVHPLLFTSRFSLLCVLWLRGNEESSLHAVVIVFLWVCADHFLAISRCCIKDPMLCKIFLPILRLYPLCKALCDVTHWLLS